MMVKQDFLDVGFKEIEHFTAMDNLTLDIGRNRHIAVGNIGSPNEIMFIAETDPKDYRIITELVCIHNYDYDGFMTSDKLQKITELFKDKTK